MEPLKIVPRDEWLVARKALLEKEKELSRQRDALARERRRLPAVRIEKDYVFTGPSGNVRLVDLFEGKKQLLIYHFMFDPSWEQGCKSCSLVSESFDGARVHLAARDVAFAAVSRAPLPKIEAFKKRMGWGFRWFSSSESDFNYDFHVSFRPEDKGKAEYNYVKKDLDSPEAPGLSAFLRQGDEVLHTYSTYSRGLDALISTYSYLDLAPLGRNEEDLPYGMAWVRHHDRYET